MNASGNYYFWSEGHLRAKSVNVGSPGFFRGWGLGVGRFDSPPPPHPNLKEKINYIMTAAFLIYKVSKSSGEEFS